MRVLLDEQLPRHLAAEISGTMLARFNSADGRDSKMASSFELPPTRALTFS
jgi:hypothetical protein